MKRLFIVLFAVLTAGVSFGQTVVSVDTLNYAQKDSTWSDQQKELWNKYSAVNPYGKKVTIDDIQGEDIVSIYYVTDITKSRKMVKDTVGNFVAEHPEQWMITYRKNGNIIAFVTYDDPTEKGSSGVNTDELATRMTAGLHQGDDEETNADSDNDDKLAPKSNEDVVIPEDF